jgi:hypothetical protein
MIGLGVHMRLQDRVDPRLVAAFAAEPLEKIRVQPHRHCFFPPRHDYACVLPEALVVCVGIFDDRGMFGEVDPVDWSVEAVRALTAGPARG